MSAEILTFIQAQSGNQAQNLQQTSSQQENSQPGLFDSIIAGLTVQDEEDIAMPPEIETQPQTFTFSKNNSFSQSVIDMLAEITPEVLNIDDENGILDVKFNLPENLDEIKNFIAEAKQKVDAAIDDVKAFVSEKLETVSEDFDAEEIIAQLLNDDDFNEKLNALPEETKQEVLCVLNEAVNALKNFGSSDVKAKVVNLLDNITEKIQAPKIYDAKLDKFDDNKDDKQDDEENSDVEANNSGLAGVVVFAADDKNINVEAKPETHNIPVKNNVQARNVQRENPEVTIKAANENETAKPETNFSEVLDTTEAEHENSNQNNFAGNQQDDNNSDNFTQPRENFTAQRNSRTRNDSRKVDARNDNNNSSSSTQRTQSHSNFQSYFEGVLINRRTASRTSPMPLNLRTSANFTQSATLRDGLINVVRFIRADGVHKANVVIDPPALGRISVELTSGTSGVEASIKVASEQIRQLVQDQLDQLRMNLSQQGVQVAEFTVDVQQDNSGSQQQNSQQGNQQGRFFVEADEEPEEFRVDLEEGLLYWVA